MKPWYFYFFLNRKIEQVLFLMISSNASLKTKKIKNGFIKSKVYAEIKRLNMQEPIAIAKINAKLAMQKLK